MGTSPSAPAPAAGGLERALPAAYYLDEGLYARERERIFHREWFCAGREATLSRTGDYLQIDVAGESVIVARTESGELRAFYNVCRHRGSRLCAHETGCPAGAAAPGPSGTFPGAIRCPYHSWTYELDGRLRRAPFLERAAAFSPEAFALAPVAVGTWGGFIFVNLTLEEAAQPGGALLDRIGLVPSRVARYPLADLRIGERRIYDVGANWKVIAENYNECYHCAGVHPELCRIVPAFKEQGGAGLDWTAGIPHRAGAYTFTTTGTTGRAPFPGLSEEERTRHKGELCYPNLMLSLSCDHVAAFTLWPAGPSRTWIVCDFLFHPDEMRRPGFDPGDAVEFWDLVNRQDWAVCALVQGGMTSRAFTAGYFAPMEDASLDIRRYVTDRLGPIAPDVRP